MLLYLFYSKTKSFTLFNTHPIFTFKTLKLLKMFLKHIIKTLHVSVITVWISSGAVFRTSCHFYISACLLRPSCLFGMWLYVVYVCVCVCVCVSDVLSVWCLVEFTTRHHTDKYIGHTNTHTYTTYSHIPNKQLDEANNRRYSNGTMHERRPPEDGQTVMTETCRVLIMCFKKHFL
jgi:hypothetical protein